MKRLILITVVLLLTKNVYAQSSYRYSLDLNKVNNDQLMVELLVPNVVEKEEFHFPKIIPGTYNISNYGKFISDLKAYDKKGKSLAVDRISDNIWKINNSSNLYRITYIVEDIFDTEKQHQIYPMAATNIEENINYVLNNPGVFGFFKGLNQLPYEINITKPKNLYASTALSDKDASETTDLFKTDNVDQLYDAPIMYTMPDTTIIRVGNADVLVSVYSPGKLVTSKDIAGWLKSLLDATRQYLGGRLPTNKYAFLYYFVDRSANNSFPRGLGGALEHQTSSFYYLNDQPASNLQNMITDISSHEFFHIITPLTIASKEIKQFNYREPDLSKHLWLYEGVTEYSSHHVQVKYGLNTTRQFLEKLSQKITISRRDYNDKLPFTELSEYAAGKHKDQYGNVYEKGALIAAVLDIYLLHLSEGNYGLRNLTYDLGVRYGKNNYFNDDELFDVMGELTYPEIKNFMVKYVSGSDAIPYDYFFHLAGINFIAKSERRVVSFGGIAMDQDERGVILVGEQSNLNEFGKKLGYKKGDEIYAFNEYKVNSENIQQTIDALRQTLQEGETFKVKVGRKNNGKIDTLLLSAPVTFVTVAEINKLDFIANPTIAQQKIRMAWLTTRKPSMTQDYPVDSNDVQTVHAIVKAVYDVISGDAGERNWNRFHSLFFPEAKMGTVIPRPKGQMELVVFSPDEYQKNNQPFFMQSGFYEQELGRNRMDYGNIVTVQSAYQFRFSEDGPVQMRGVNFFTLIQTEGRWWIQNLVWQSETPENQIPVHLVK